MADADDITGIVHEDIKAIEIHSELVAFFDALKPYPYWRAFAAVACLCGPRKSEQFNMKLDDFVNCDVVKIRASKTGRQRRVAIERSILKPILEEHIARRKEERAIGKSAAERSDYLFPTILDDGPRERSTSEPSVWTSGFYRAWKRLKEDLKTQNGLALSEYYWEFGPDEWRHTFGTALANCGWTSLDIARAMGNSPRVAESHYIAQTSQNPENRWPLKF